MQPTVCPLFICVGVKDVVASGLLKLTKTLRRVESKTSLAGPASSDQVCVL
jgi:hypothetical protein